MEQKGFPCRDKTDRFCRHTIAYWPPILPERGHEAAGHIQADFTEADGLLDFQS